MNRRATPICGADIARPKPRAARNAASVAARRPAAAANAGARTSSTGTDTLRRRGSPTSSTGSGVEAILLRQADEVPPRDHELVRRARLVAVVPLQRPADHRPLERLDRRREPPRVVGGAPADARRQEL